MGENPAEGDNFKLRVHYIFMEKDENIKLKEQEVNITFGTKVLEYAALIFNIE